MSINNYIREYGIDFEVKYSHEILWLCTKILFATNRLQLNMAICEESFTKCLKLMILKNIRP